MGSLATLKGGLRRRCGWSTLQAPTAHAAPRQSPGKPGAVAWEELDP